MKKTTCLIIIFLLIGLLCSCEADSKGPIAAQHGHIPTPEYGYRTVKYDIYEAIDDYVGKAASYPEEHSEYGGTGTSSVIDYLFDGDVDLAKDTFGKLVDSVLRGDTYTVDIIRVYDQETKCASERSEQWRITDENMFVYINIPSSSRGYSDMVKNTTSQGEYYTVRKDSPTRFIIDLGNGVEYLFYFNITDLAGNEEIINDYLQYGFMLKELVSDK